MKLKLLFLASVLIMLSAPAPRQEEKEPEYFNPTEKLSADGAVSFPIDI